ncbi:MAG: hypothetical protein HYU27_05290 [Acidobacteria bacterium]|nr:hypothetical protein [Acidobacteriota bacterium]
MIRKVLVVVLVTAGAFLFGLTAYAHHSFAATYDEKKVVKIEGKLVQFLFRNPHSFVHVEAPDENGQVQRWSVEWGGAGQLGTQGVTRNTLKVGDVVIITGILSRSPGEHRVRMNTLRRTSDGFGWGARPGETVD